MPHEVWTFLRLVWAEWASRVTGSSSAVLVLLGLGISLAGTLGWKIPAESVVQLGIWTLAAVCGGQAAYLVWAKEHKARETVENRIKSLLGEYDYALRLDSIEHHEIRHLSDDLTGVIDHAGKRFLPEADSLFSSYKTL
jgi:hypothetical protein